MKNLVFLYDITIYTAQIISLIFTFFIYHKHKNKTLKYYLLVMLMLFDDNTIEISRIYIESIYSMSTLFNILKNCTLSLELYVICIFIYYLTESKMTLFKKIISMFFSMMPILLVLIDLKFTATSGFEKKFFWINIFFQVTAITYLLFIIIANYKNITNKFILRIRKIAVIFIVLTSILYFIDTLVYLNGFYLSYIFVLVWNIMNIYYLWKYNLSGNNISGNEETLKKFKITLKEKEIISYIKGGLMNKEIAYKLGTSESSIKIKVHKIFKKTGAKSRIELLNLLG